MTYQCRECGYATARWMGFCPQCRAQGAMTEVEPVTRHRSSTTPVPVTEAGCAERARRLESGLVEVDRVLGGGLVPGSVVLVGGEPGVGKSTLLLQMAGAIAAGNRVLYVTGEESVSQVGDRAARLQVTADGLEVLAESDVAAVEDAVAAGSYRAVVVDSVQAMRVDEASGTPGAITQVRETGARFTALARRLGIPVVLVGHVTKEGSLAGPKVVEHLVDAVLYLEGDPDRRLRYLRGLKNRYGSVSQVGVFEMTATGMAEVPDPSGLFVGASVGAVPGTVVFPARYGRRTLLVEVQALVGTRTGIASPRRSVTGLSPRRVHQILAVLDRHAGVDCTMRDVFVSVVGGLTVDEPAADLAAAVAITSSLLDQPLGRTAAMGEVGLAGEVRAPSGADERRSELARFGIGAVVGGGPSPTVARAMIDAGITMDGVRRLVAAR